MTVTLTLSFTNLEGNRKTFQVDRGLNPQSPTPWWCTLSFELLLPDGKSFKIFHLYLNILISALTVKKKYSEHCPSGITIVVLSLVNFWANTYKAPFSTPFFRGPWSTTSQEGFFRHNAVRRWRQPSPWNGEGCSPALSLLSLIHI